MVAFDTVVQIDPPDQALVIVNGDLDLMTAPLFSGAVTSALQQTEAPTLRLDLRGVGFIDSTGVDALIRLDRAVPASGGTLELVASSRYVERVLRLVGLGDLFV